jgi:hypothetical protein
MPRICADRTLAQQITMRPITGAHAAISEADRLKIGRTNAAGLFKL